MDYGKALFIDGTGGTGGGTLDGGHVCRCRALWTVVDLDSELTCRRWRSRDGYAELVVVGGSLHGEGEGGSVDRERA